MMVASTAMATKLFRGPLRPTSLTSSRLLLRSTPVITGSRVTARNRASAGQQFITTRPLSTSIIARFFKSSSTKRATPSSSPSHWTPPREASLEDRPVLVIGAGNHGRRIALVWASACRPVTIYDNDPEALRSSIEYITDNLGAYCAWRASHPGHVCPTTNIRVATTTGRYEGTNGTTDAEDTEIHSGSKGPWMAIDCLPDKLDLKIEVLSHIEDFLPGDCIIASSSSSLQTAELAPHMQHPERLLNTHYFVPPRNRMVELMSSTHTHPEIFPFLEDQMRNVGFTPITIAGGIQSPGFIFNRIWGAAKRETLAVLSEGIAKPKDVDALFRDFFHAEKGPCERMDEVGLDTVVKVETHSLEKQPELGKRHAVDWLRGEYVERGKLGERSGDGLFTKQEREELKAMHKRDHYKPVDETTGA
ncbi:hypothetical protein QBC34DRAFT_414241 [Podospora aff. communis PSN243]|uniref:3-hydroxyacyl-CoA dehydrogenase n=1 Tax=Podospora aff. communis PSN243 TaxID=3040156 RepID=A0AAV9GCN1_9PEZI|nr:hypothetical protein QBC34DRAFT_414241 [Podospora aff. communis PSN243]